MLPLIKALLTFEAFTPHPLARKVPLALRFEKRSIMGITVTEDALEVCTITFNAGVPALSNFESFDLVEPDGEVEFLRNYSEKSKLTYCLLNVAKNFTASKTTRAIKPSSDEEAIELMHNEPEKMLGEPPEPGTRYALVSHPTHNFAISFAFKIKDIEAAEQLAQKAGLSVAAVRHGSTSLLAYIIRNRWNNVIPESEVFFLEPRSVFTVNASERSFGTPGFATFSENAIDDEVAERLAATIKPNAKLVLVNGTKSDVKGVASAKAAELDGAVKIEEPLAGLDRPNLQACCLDNSYDLASRLDEVRPHAPGNIKFVPVAFYASLAMLLLLGVLNFFRTTQAQQETQHVLSQTQDVAVDLSKYGDETLRIQKRLKFAEKVRLWLGISPSMQKLMLDVTEALKSSDGSSKTTAAVDSMSVTMAQGLPQLRLVLVVISDDPLVATRMFQRVSAMLGSAGYKTIDYKEAPVAGGFRYEHTIILPSAAVIR